MPLPLQARAGFEEVPLIEGGQVMLRVVRVGFAWRAAGGEGTWQFVLPLMVLDRRGNRTKMRPVIDFDVVLPAAAILAAILFARKRSSDV